MRLEDIYRLPIRAPFTKEILIAYFKSYKRSIEEAKNRKGRLKYSIPSELYITNDLFVLEPEIPPLLPELPSINDNKMKIDQTYSAIPR